MQPLAPLENQKADSATGSRPDYPIMVAIVDDDANERLLIRQVLDQTGELVCAGLFRSADEALAEIPISRPHVVLMDIRMPVMDGIECARQLKWLRPELVVIFVTGLLDDPSLDRAVQTGGDDYLVKPLIVGQCVATIRFALARRRGGSAWIQSGSARGLPQLSEREKAVLEGLAIGLLYKEIANKLNTTTAMVHKLQHSLFYKLHVANRSEAIAVFYRKERPD